MSEIKHEYDIKPVTNLYQKTLATVESANKILAVWEEKAKGKAYAYAWFTNELVSGIKLENKTWKWSNEVSSETLFSDLLLRLRIFNSNGELHYWRNSDHKYDGRIILENSTEENTKEKAIQYFDTKQLLWGTKVETISQDGLFITLREKRGHEVTIPSDAIKTLANNERAFLKTRQYIQPNDYGQYSIFDNRFVGFEKV